MAGPGPQYPDHYIDRLEILWGKGFLSPGGPDEIALLIGDRDITGANVLDLGCGIGGPSLLLVSRFGAGHVTGVDIEPELIARAEKIAWRPTSPTASPSC